MMKKLCSLLLAGMMVIGMMPVVATAAVETEESTPAVTVMSNTIDGKTFPTSDTFEFSIATTIGTDAAGETVLGASEFDQEDALLTLDYKEDGSWKNLLHDGDGYFGPSEGISIPEEYAGKSLTNEFRVRFGKPGTYSFTAKLVDKDTKSPLASTSATFTVTSDGVATVNGKEYATLSEAIEKATPNSTITLIRDVNLSDATGPITISKSLTIDGQGHTITGNPSNANVYFQITGASVNVQVSNAVFTNFGDQAGSVVGAGVFKIPEDASYPLLTADHVTVEKFNRAAFDVRNGVLQLNNSTIHCDNGQKDRLTKGVVVGYSSHPSEAVIQGCTITGANSTYEGWSASGIEASAGATVNVSDTTITSMKGGISVARNYGTGAAHVTVKDCTVDASDFALRIFESNSTSDPVEGSSALLEVTGGNYKGDVRISRGSGKPDDKQSTITINSGNFTVNPSKFVAEGLSVLPGTVPGYSFTVGESQTANRPEDVNSAAGGPVVDVDKIPVDQQEEVKDAANSVKDIQGVLGVIADTVSVTEQQKADAEKAIKDINSGVTVGGDPVKVYAQAYLKISATGYTESEGTKSLALDIQPMSRIVATTAENANAIKVVGETTGDTVANAVVLENSQQEIPSVPTMTLSIILPSGFAGGKNTLYVGHHDHYHKGTVSDSNLTFTTEGFSPFEISTKDITPVAQIGDSVYTSLQEAVNDVPDAGTITLLAEIDSATSVTVSGSKTFTLVPDAGVSTTGIEKYLTVNGKNVTVSDGKVVVTVTSTGGTPGTGSGETYENTVAATTNGKVTVTNAKKGETATITTTADKGYKVGTVTVKDEKGNTISVTDAGSGKYTFTQPEGKVSVTVTFVWDNPFTDVKSSDWWYDAVQYVNLNGLMAGTGTNTFAPAATLTRAQAVQVLYNLEGQPAVDGTNTFTDVASDHWGVKAITWASANGVVAGVGNNQFAPDVNVSREQFAQMMYNYATYKKYETSATADLSKFPDQGSVSSWAEKALSWANAEGLINGSEADGVAYLMPAGTATRGQTASILTNFDKNIVA